MTQKNLFASCAIPNLSFLITKILKKIKEKKNLKSKPDTQQYNKAYAFNLASSVNASRSLKIGRYIPSKKKSWSL